MLISDIQVYRHLLFNRLGRDDDRFDVRPLSSHSALKLTSPVPALHHPPQHPSPPLRRLPNLGAHREALSAPPPFLPPSLHCPHKLDPGPNKRRAPLHPAARPPIPLLPLPRHPQHALLPHPDPAAVLAPAGHPVPLPAAVVAPPCPALPALPAPAGPLLPAPDAAVDRAAGVQLHEAVPDPADHLGVRLAVERERGQLGRHRE